ncbi:leucine tRS [Acrasis kona]|uniref:Leucine tRS n=1 Tax=Acrasis kona TaxID=1008807 RepID=A0AAW2ZKZ8_9EUKA
MADNSNPLNKDASNTSTGTAKSGAPESRDETKDTHLQQSDEKKGAESVKQVHEHETKLGNSVSESNKNNR